MAKENQVKLFCKVMVNVHNKGTASESYGLITSTLFKTALEAAGSMIGEGVVYEVRIKDGRVVKMKEAEV